MKMRLLVGVLSIGLLGGCSSDQAAEGRNPQSVVESTQSTLSSHLWINMMPTIGELQDTQLHGSLYIESTQVLPVDMDVQSVLIRQDGRSWMIHGEYLDLRTHSPNQWEVAFVWQFEINPDLPVDIELALKTNDSVERLTEKNVEVQRVY
ncbi:hypothetical protein [Vibrio japonicus]|uniref:DNA polymerase III subunit beta n=1 Tax=Vibrio japonicus TaxID=1824638 RepID=A0ABY5LJH4_9VIBR|nr:hypothetical protein [Vibrio japonicus]UUM31071.1 hypothetical protein NP165_02670 [Vibrio japonicus]